MSEGSTGVDGQTHRTHLVSYSLDTPSSGASRHSNNNNGAKDGALGISNEHILYGHV